jgi:hypothetical protein
MKLLQVDKTKANNMSVRMQRTTHKANYYCTVRNLQAGGNLDVRPAKR